MGVWEGFFSALVDMGYIRKLYTLMVGKRDEIGVGATLQ